MKSQVIKRKQPLENQEKNYSQQSLNINRNDMYDAEETNIIIIRDKAEI